MVQTLEFLLAAMTEIKDVLATQIVEDALWIIILAAAVFAQAGDVAWQILRFPQVVRCQVALLSRVCASAHVDLLIRFW